MAIFYASQNMPEDDSSASGGTINSGIRIAMETLDAPTGDANITVSGTSQNVIGTIPIYESGFRAPFYKATASAGSSKDFYEKIFIKNVNAATTIYDSKIIQIPNCIKLPTINISERPLKKNIDLNKHITNPVIIIPREIFQYRKISF